MISNHGAGQVPMNALVAKRAEKLPDRTCPIAPGGSLRRNPEAALSPSWSAFASGRMGP
jgi:hypothetical protein